METSLHGQGDVAINLNTNKWLQLWQNGNRPAYQSRCKFISVTLNFYHTSAFGQQGCGWK